MQTPAEKNIELAHSPSIITVCSQADVSGGHSQFCGLSYDRKPEL